MEGFLGFEVLDDGEEVGQGLTAACLSGAKDMRLFQAHELGDRESLNLGWVRVRYGRKDSSFECAENFGAKARGLKTTLRDALSEIGDLLGSPLLGFDERRFGRDDCFGFDLAARVRCLR